MRKRTALARTLIYEPETLLMDEPFGALDAQLRLLLMDQLQRLTQLRRITVVFVTHDLAEAIALADRVVIMSARPGQIRRIREVPCRDRGTSSSCGSPKSLPSCTKSCGRAEGRSRERHGQSMTGMHGARR
jgi:ABC-type nitrate/sulfonate/bicarbonate transport system ATPase subunit